RPMNKLARIEEADARSLGGARTFWKGRGRDIARVGSLVLLGAALLVGLVLYLLTGRYESTDNAYVQANKVYLSAEVEGRAVAIPARANQTVKAGDVLFRIDDAPYRIALAKAEADVETTRNGISALQASISEKSAALGAARANLAY